MSEILVARKSEKSLDQNAVIGMYKLRHAVFHDRLGWEVSSDNGMEHDVFDEVDPVYVLVRGDGEQIIGCWRLLPTTGPYMLKDVFPQLLHGRPAPEQPDVWELSRFAVAESESAGTGFGLGDTPLGMIRAAVKFAQLNGISRYVSVTSVAIERMFRKLGVSVTRLGEPIRIGRVLTVACTLEIDNATAFALFGALPEHAPRIAA